MFRLYQFTSLFSSLVFLFRKVSFLFLISFLVVACGEFAEIEGDDSIVNELVDNSDPVESNDPVENDDPVESNDPVENDDPVENNDPVDNGDQNESEQVEGMTISWDPITVNGENAETYRVLYSRPGERPLEVHSDTNQATLSVYSLSGYTVYIEAFNNYRNSVFELYNP